MKDTEINLIANSITLEKRYKELFNEIKFLITRGEKFSIWPNNGNDKTVLVFDYDILDGLNSAVRDTAKNLKEYCDSKNISCYHFRNCDIEDEITLLNDDEGRLEIHLNLNNLDEKLINNKILEKYNNYIEVEND